VEHFLILTVPGLDIAMSAPIRALQNVFVFQTHNNQRF
jgi:hypothetical protein